MQNYVKVVQAQGLLDEQGGRPGRGPGRAWGPFIFSTDCHSQFVGLPLRLLLKTPLTLRGSGRSRLGAAPPPRVPFPLLPGRRPCLALSMPGRGICRVRAMGADSQSGRFKLCDLARQAVQDGDEAGRPGLREPWGVDVAGRAEDAGGHAEKGHRKPLTGTCPPSLSPSSPSD